MEIRNVKRLVEEKMIVLLCTKWEDRCQSVLREALYRTPHRRYSARIRSFTTNRQNARSSKRALDGSEIRGFSKYQARP